MMELNPNCFIFIQDTKSIPTPTASSIHINGVVQSDTTAASEPNPYRNTSTQESWCRERALIGSHLYMDMDSEETQAILSG